MIWNNYIKLVYLFIFIVVPSWSINLNENVNEVSKKLYNGDNTNLDLRILLGEEFPEIKENLAIAEVTSSKDKEENNIRLLLEATSNYYTINIATLNNFIQAEEFLLKNLLSRERIIIYSFGPEMSSVKIVFGIFKSIKDAYIAL
ncbi:MAG: hypothetical protein R2837_12380, partial [Aliarcobacter sp.]